tara:strand:- start:3737 stop:3961 length:225 start_codon:yes stop_codon:yes gene_type:complete
MHLEKITWLDSHSPTATWVDPDEVRTSPCVIKSVGYVVRETKTAITIAASVSDEGIVNAPLTIPLVCITKRKRI